MVGGRPLSAVGRRREQIAALVELCTAVSEEWKGQTPKRIPRADERSEWIRRPDLVTDLVERYFGPRWRADWSPRVLADPNRFAVVRWARFIAWYCVLRAEGQTKKYENNFDDAHYGLLASYTGTLGSNDRGLNDAFTAIFPKAQALSLEALVPV